MKSYPTPHTDAVRMILVIVFLIFCITAGIKFYQDDQKPLVVQEKDFRLCTGVADIACPNSLSYY